MGKDNTMSRLRAWRGRSKHNLFLSLSALFLLARPGRAAGEPYANGTKVETYFVNTEMTSEFKTKAVKKSETPEWGEIIDTRVEPPLLIIADLTRCSSCMGFRWKAYNPAWCKHQDFHGSHELHGRQYLIHVDGELSPPQWVPESYIVYA